MWLPVTGGWCEMSSYFETPHVRSCMYTCCIQTTCTYTSRITRLAQVSWMVFNYTRIKPQNALWFPSSKTPEIPPSVIFLNFLCRSYPQNVPWGLEGIIYIHSQIYALISICYTAVQAYSIACAKWQPCVISVTTPWTISYFQ